MLKGKEKIKMIAMAIGLLLFIGGLAFVFYWIWHHETYIGSNEPVDSYFMASANDANCTFIKQQDTVVMVDTCELVDAQSLLQFLKDKGVAEIQYLILTHPDQDHIGGAAAVLEELPVRHVIMPYFTKENVLLESLTEKIKTLNIPVTYPTRPRTFTTGSLQFTVYPALEKKYKKDNNYSLAVLMKHHEIAMLFPGDAESKRLQELMRIHWPAIQLYQVAHHCRANSSSASFFEIINPQYAICNAAKSDDEILQISAKLGTQLFYTREKTLHFRSNGSKLSLIQ